ncbi:MAG: TonB-dependent receptor, partial [Oceanicaulis sp.]
MTHRPATQRRARLLGAAALAAALSAPAFAEAHPDVVVVQSSPIGVDNRSVVGAVTVIDDDELIRNLEGNIADTLEHVPGVTSTYFGPAAGRPIVRGLGADRVRFLINGLGGLDASASSPDHAVAAEVLGADAVEVLRGPAAIAFGGNAVGGVVNVLDGRVPTKPVDGLLDGFVYAGRTSVDDGAQFAGRLAGQVGAVVIQGDFVRRDADGFKIPGFAETEAEREEHHGDHDDDHHDDHDHDDHEEHHEEEEPESGLVEGAFYTFESASVGASIVEDWGHFGLSVKETDAEYGLPGHSHAHGHDDDHDHDDHDDHDDDHHGGDDDHGHEHGEEGAPVLVMDQTRVDLRGEINRDGFFNRIRFAAAHSDYTHAELEGDEIGTLFDIEGAEARLEIAHDHGGARRGAWGLNAFTRDFQAAGEEAYIEPVTTQDWGAFLADEVLANWRRWDRDPADLKAVGGLGVFDMYMADDHRLHQHYTQQPRAMIAYDVNNAKRRSDHIDSPYGAIFSTFSEGWIGLHPDVNFWYRKDWTGPDFNPAGPYAL